MPRRLATATTFCGPTSTPSCTAMVLTECTSASCSVIGAAIAAVVILGRIAVDGDGLIGAHRIGVEAALQRRQIDERLERAARLAARLGRAVERAFGIVAPADQRAHRAVGRHDTSAAWPACERWPDLSSTRAMAARAASSIAGSMVVTMMRSPDAVRHQVLGLVGGGVEEIIARGVARLVEHGGGLGARGLGLFRGDGADFDHGFEHAARRAPGRRARSRRGENTRRRAGERGQHRRFGQRHALGAFAEIDARRAVDAIGARTQIDAVQIEFEDLVLGEPILPARAPPPFPRACATSSSRA